MAKKKSVEQDNIFETEPIVEELQEDPPPVENVKEEEDAPLLTKELPKKKRKSAPMTDARREQLKKNLAKGRATALKNRQKKAKLKAIAKNQKVEEEDKIIEQDIKKRNRSNELAKENEELKKQLAAQAQARVSPPPRPVAAKPKAKSPPPIKKTKPPPVRVDTPPPPTPQVRSMLPGGFVLNL